MKLEIVADASGLPLGAATAAANVSEYQLATPALDDVPIQIPEGTLVIADRSHDSDRLRDDIEDEGLEPIIPHRRDRIRTRRNDVGRLRRYRRRYVIERTIAWLHCYRELAVCWAYYSFIWIGPVYTAFIAMALKWF